MGDTPGPSPSRLTALAGVPDETTLGRFGVVSSPASCRKEGFESVFAMGFRPAVVDEDGFEDLGVDVGSLEELIAVECRYDNCFKEVKRRWAEGKEMKSKTHVRETR